MSGTFTSTIADSLFLDLSWSVLSQDIANNRSRVRLELRLRHTGTGVWFSASKSGVLQGSSFTYTGGFSGSGTRTLQTRDIWIDHNSDGSKTQNINGSFNIALTYSGTYRGNTSVSGNITLPTIPRASSITSFSIGSALQPSTANTVNLAISRASSGFTHDIQLSDGTTVIASWNGQGLPTSLPISASQVNTLLGRMSNVTSKSLTLRVQTKSGSTNIGSAVTRNATATVNSNVTPTATGLSVSINGTGRDSVISKYIQNISRVTASFTGTATGGATVSSRSIVVRQDTTKGNSMTINSNSGTTGVVTQSGLYEAIATVRDSRGRTTTQRITFTVHAYSPPTITTFTADRNSATPTTVNISRAGNFTPLGTGDNTLTILIQRSADGGTTWTNVESTSTAVATFSGTVNSTENIVTSSYQFRIIITDSFGNSAEATATVTTQRVVLDVHRNEGVGIGKLHEQGVLDVDGEIFTNGRLNIVPDIYGSYKADAIVIRSKDPNGHSYIEYWGSDNVRKGIVGYPTTSQNHFEIRNDNGDVRLTPSSNGEVRVRDTSIVARGSNSNGDWVRFYDGTQICWQRFASPPMSGGVQTWTKTFPIAFLSGPVMTLSRDGYIAGSAAHDRATMSASEGATEFTINYFSGTGTGLSGTRGIRYIAIGRWR